MAFGRQHDRSWSLPIVAGITLGLLRSIAGVAHADVPVNVAPPYVTGVAGVGQRLAADPGAWADASGSFRFLWERCSLTSPLCIPLAPRPSSRSSYKIGAADAGYRLRVRVLATNADGDAAAESAPTDVVVGRTLATTTHCGRLAKSERWSPTTVHRITCLVTVPAGMRLTIARGAVVKVGGTIIVEPGGTLKAQGSASSPITFTSPKDDWLGGDTNGDGRATIPGPNDYPNTIVPSGTVVIRFARFRFGNVMTILREGNVDLRDSVIEGQIAVRGGRPIMQRNTFQGVRRPLQLTNLNTSFPIDPTGISFSGSDTNVFQGAGGERLVAIANTTIPVGSHWSLSSDGGAVIGLGAYSSTVSATLEIPAGASLAVEPGTIVKGAPFLVRPGGTLHVRGALLADIADDTAGGDTNGDGSATTPPDLDAFHQAIGTDPDGSTVVEDSEFRSLDMMVQSRAAVELRGNHFRRRLVVRAAERIVAERNVFDHVDFPIVLNNLNSTGSIDPTGISFSGDTGNVFEGDGPQRTIALVNVIVPSGKTWGISSDGGAVFAVGYSPYPISSALVVAAGGALAIQPGTILKGEAPITVDDGGALYVHGESARPAVFTSLADDSIGGDTTGDGTLTSPASGDVPTAFSIDGVGIAVVRHAVVRYAGTAFSFLLPGNPQSLVESCDFLETKAGIVRRVPVWLQPFPGAYLGPPLNAPKNYWGDPYGPATTPSNRANIARIGITPPTTCVVPCWPYNWQGAGCGLLLPALLASNGAQATVAIESVTMQCGKVTTTFPAVATPIEYQPWADMPINSLP